MQELEASTLNALDYLDQGFTIFDADLKLVQWNRHLVTMLEFPDNFVRKGINIEELIRFNAQRGEYGSGDVEKLVEERTRLAREFKSHRFERTRPDGTVIEIRGRPLASGGFVTIYTDVTERKRQEQFLQESHDELERRVEERTASLRAANAKLQQEINAHMETSAALKSSGEWIRNITDNIPALIGYMDLDGQLEFANVKLKSVLATPDPAYALVLPNFHDHPMLGKYLKNEFAAARSGETAFRDVTTEDIDGGNRVLTIGLVPHRDQSTTITGLFLIGRDITSYKATQEALQESSKLNAVGQLTGSLAHDFGNLLTIIKGNLSFIQSLLDEQPDDLKGPIQACIKTADRGSELTKRLLAFARRQSLQPRKLNLQDLLEDLQLLLTRSLGDSIHLSTNLDAELNPVYADPSHLEAALLNLAFNAKDAMPRGGRIRIGARNIHCKRRRSSTPDLAPGEYVRLSVKDQGIGIARDQLCRVVEPFYTTKEVGSGTGLGLSTVYGFVKQSQGDMRILSEPGQGTTVELYLPSC